MRWARRDRYSIKALLAGSAKVARADEEVRKSMDLWEACNKRLFVDPRGNFFRDDTRLRAWMYNYRKRLT